MSNKNKEPALIIKNMTVVYNQDPVLWNVSVVIPQGILLAVVGPNGAGKTTFLRSIIQMVKPIAGVIHIFGDTYKKVRRKIAYVPQRSSVDWDFPTTVLDIVLMGRYGHLGWFRRPGKNDIALAQAALLQVGLHDRARSPISQLSGGQQQRVFLARALVQDADMYLMDEPFTGIDRTTEKIIVTILQKLRSEGKTIIIVHHDIHTLGEYFDWILLLNIERIACGPVDMVLVPQYMCAAYGDRTILQKNIVSFKEQ